MGNIRGGDLEMIEKECCGNCKNCGCSNGCGHGMMMLDCCKEHKMSKEHLKAKKKMLEEKLKWVEEQLSLK